MIELKDIDPTMIANNITPFYPTHPGEVIKDEIEYRGISQKQLSQSMGMPYKALNDILNERRPVTTESAILFEAALDISAETLLNMQVQYNLVQAKRNPTLISRLSSIRRIAAAL